MSLNYRMRLPYSNFNGLRIIGKDTATVAVVEQWAANQGHTDFIVRAANSHDQLVAALQEAKALLALNGIDIDDNADYGNGVAGDIVARIAVALAAAGAA